MPAQSQSQSQLQVQRLASLAPAKPSGRPAFERPTPGRPTPLIDTLAGFATHTRAEDVPAEVRDEAARIVLDSLGCALASGETDPGTIGVRYAQVLGGGAADATVIGVGRSSLHGAAYANCELIAALDMAPINQPGHVAPYVVSTALAVAETLEREVAVAEVITAVAVGLEIAARFARAVDTNRTVVDGEPVLSSVMGFASSTFAAAVAAARLRGADVERMLDVIGIAAATSPVNSLRSWQMHEMSSSVKYGLGGGLVQAALNAALVAELGHRGDRLILDDQVYGYRRFIGTERWVPELITDGLGPGGGCSDWFFPAGTHFKPYPHCRVTHAVFDAVYALTETHDLNPDEIESITAYGEAWATGVPTYMNDVIERPYDAQFSFRHGIATAAHRIPPGRAWQDPDVVCAPSIEAMKPRITWKAHAGWAQAFAAHPSARPTKVEIVARGTTFTEERDYPKGSTTPDPSTRMSTEELVDKFRHNAHGVIDDAAATSVVDALVHPDTPTLVRDLMAALQPS